MARRDAAREPPADSAEALAQRLADGLAQLSGPVRRQVAEGLRELGAVDQAIYSAVASTPTPSLDEPLRRLSNAANNSRLWLAIAAGLAVAGGPPGRPAAGGGTLGLRLTSALINPDIQPPSSPQGPHPGGARVPG